jgi:hypothetical protein
MGAVIQACQTPSQWNEKKLTRVGKFEISG